MESHNTYIIRENVALTEAVFRMTLQGSTERIVRAGQFVNIALPGRFLRRPISVCDYDDNSITLIYKILGLGTAQMSTMQPGTTLDVLTGLGNGFNTDVPCRQPLLVSGGVGLPPLYGLTKRLLQCGKQPHLVMGFNTANDIFYLDEFRNLGLDVYVATIDGSSGFKGLVTDAIAAASLSFDYLYACGPLLMLRALSRFEVDGQLSLEQRMGCGFGACMGCSVETTHGYKRICTEGPVLQKNEIIWK